MSAAAVPDAAPVLAPNRRRRALFGLGLLLLLAAIGFGAYWWLVLRQQESTDNAYVQAPLVQITPRIDGYKKIQAFSLHRIYLQILLPRILQRRH